MPLSEGPSLYRLLGKSPVMHQLFKLIGRACNTDCAMLLVGERGTGKSLVARAIHDLSYRADHPFRVLSGKQVLESGDEELLEIDDSHAAEGSCYITDFTSMPHYVQQRLVSIHRDREYKCDHNDKMRKHNLRFIVALEGDLQDVMENNHMPVDLFYDWNFMPLFVPPLRDRKGDIPLLADHFVELAAAELRVSRRELSPEAREILKTHEWPGNLFELKACMRYALENCKGNYIRAEHLPELKTKRNSEALTMLEMFLSSRLSSYIDSSPSHLKGNIFRLLLPEMEQSLFHYALKKSRGNRNRAAHFLGLHRNTLNKKLQDPD